MNEVRRVQSQVAVLNVSYGDWWLVLPDRRMMCRQESAYTCPIITKRFWFREQA